MTNSKWLLFSLVAACVHTQINRCNPFFRDQQLGYNLIPIDEAKKEGYSRTMFDFTDPKGVEIKNPVVMFRLCQPLTRPLECPNTPETVAYLLWDGGNCRSLTTIGSLLTHSLSMPPGETVSNGIETTYDNSKLSPEVKAQVPFNLKIIITCDKSIRGAPLWSGVYSSGLITLKASSAQGCHYDLDAFLDMLHHYKWVAFGIFLLSGILFTFFGRNAYRWTLLASGFLLGFLMVNGTAYTYSMFVDATLTKKLVILGVAVLMGVLLGLVLYQLDVATLSLICGLLTIIIVMAVFAVFVPTFEMSNFIIIAVCTTSMFIGGIAASCWKE